MRKTVVQSVRISKITAVFAIFLISFLLFPLFTTTNLKSLYAGTPGDVFTYILDSSSNATITGFTGDATVDIPYTLDGHPVTSIGYDAFKGKTTITSISIPSTVTSIGNSAFQGCTALTTVTLPNSVTSIGSSAFYACTILTTVTLPNNSLFTSIEAWTFLGCALLKTITIPANVTTIGQEAFESTGLTKYYHTEYSHKYRQLGFFLLL